MTLVVQLHLQKLREDYDKDRFIAGPREIVTLKDDCEKIALQLPNEGSISQATEIEGWKITPQNMMEVRHSL